MERITITVDEKILSAFDAYMSEHGYKNRSEAFRDLLREKLTGERIHKKDSEHVVACLSYVYDHARRDLASRMVAAQHDHHDLGMATLHIHLDHENCLETTVLQGSMKDVRAFADAVSTSTGVRHGNLHVVPVSFDRAGHRHHKQGTSAVHMHSHPHA